MHELTPMLYSHAPLKIRPIRGQSLVKITPSFLAITAVQQPSFIPSQAVKTNRLGVKL